MISEEMSEMILCVPVSIRAIKTLCFYMHPKKHIELCNELMFTTYSYLGFEIIVNSELPIDCIYFMD